jgi:hypothetical protein
MKAVGRRAGHPEPPCATWTDVGTTTERARRPALRHCVCSAMGYQLGDEHLTVHVRLMTPVAAFVMVKTPVLLDVDVIV